jgi:hypothetical protein
VAQEGEIMISLTSAENGKTELNAHVPV